MLRYLLLFVALATPGCGIFAYGNPVTITNGSSYRAVAAFNGIWYNTGLPGFSMTAMLPNGEPCGVLDPTQVGTAPLVNTSGVGSKEAGMLLYILDENNVPVATANYGFHVQQGSHDVWLVVLKNDGVYHNMHGCHTLVCPWIWFDSPSAPPEP